MQWNDRFCRVLTVPSEHECILDRETRNVAPFPNATDRDNAFELLQMQEIGVNGIAWNPYDGPMISYNDILVSGSMNKFRLVSE